MANEDLTAPSQTELDGIGVGGLFALTDRMDKIMHAVIDLVNQQRVAAGRGPLLWSDNLRNTARNLCYDARRVKWWNPGANFHINPAIRVLADDNQEEARQIELRIRSSNLPNLTAWAENCYAGWGVVNGTEQATARAAMTWWMNSQRHRDNILNPAFTHLGAGVTADIASSVPPPGIQSGDHRGLFVQHFVRRG